MQWPTHSLLLTWTAGTLDGLSYIGAHVFTANMTGNTVLLGLHIVRGETVPAIRCAVALAAYAVGCSMAAVFEPDHVPWLRNLTIASRVEFPLIAICSALWIMQTGWGDSTLQLVTVVLAATALGIQSVAVRSLHVSGVVTTFITGTVTVSATELVHAIRNRCRTGAWPADMAHTVLLMAMFTIYLAAAMVAGYLTLHHPFIAAVLPLPSLVPLMVRSE